MRKRAKQRVVRALIALLLIAAVYLCLRPAALPEQPWPEPGPLLDTGPLITVLLADGSCQTMPLERFLLGVVAAEMPASFAEQALQAQAVAARSYLLAHSAPYGRPRHENADICTDSRHCQAYASEQELRQRWGEAFSANFDKVTRAVAASYGVAVCYAGSPVETPYCSTCGGYTQAARDVWGQDIPYLQAVPCSWDAHSPRFSGMVLLSVSEAAKKLAVQPGDLAKMRATSGAGGAIVTLRVGEKSFSGLEMRQALGLDSACCQWLIAGEMMLLSTRGFGHGVGLCQYGADGMAKAGYTAQQILLHYYQGAELLELY